MGPLEERGWACIEVSDMPSVRAMLRMIVFFFFMIMIMIMVVIMVVVVCGRATIGSLDWLFHIASKPKGCGNHEGQNKERSKVHRDKSCDIAGEMVEYLEVPFSGS
jgi:hypothetical protein